MFSPRLYQKLMDYMFSVLSINWIYSRPIYH